jgi:7,8-dihydropterin-6-yl-methyl-4-(beta-D-ribofuranosyl)aminobenzene 5'-phosphate synthase
MKIVTLIENVVYKGGLYAEHGLSLYITAGSRKILFDTGQSGLFIDNAKQLGIDIADVDVLVLSHGHYDHTGGLHAFLEINSKAIVYANGEIFMPKYKGKVHFNGMKSCESAKERFSFIDSVTQLNLDVFIFPNIDLYHPVDTNFKMLYKKVGDSFYPDDFADELFMVIRKNNHINVITACSHRGISNICTTAQNHFNLPVNMIVGGFHMKDCGTEQYLHIIEYFRQLKPKLIGVCHCTGIEKYAGLKNDLASKVFYNFTGNEITIK